MDDDLKNILFEIFAVLGLSDEEKKKTLFAFQKKIAAEVLLLVQAELPKEYRDFIAEHGAEITDANHPMVATIKAALQKIHSQDEYRKMARNVFQKLIPEYAAIAKEGLNAEKDSELEKVLAELK